MHEVQFAWVPKQLWQGEVQGWQTLLMRISVPVQLALGVQVFPVRLWPAMHEVQLAWVPMQLWQGEVQGWQTLLIRTCVPVHVGMTLHVFPVRK
jgi:hypothetical protein